MAVAEMFDRIAPRYDVANRLISLGLDRGWRRRAVGVLGAERGARVLDVACGTGDLVREASKAGLRPVGVDLSPGMLRAAGGLRPLVLGDGLALPFRTASVDAVTCGFGLRNAADPVALLGEMARVCRPGGRLALLEVAEPEWAAARVVHRMYFRRVVPIIGGIVSDRRAYSYLPDSTRFLPSWAELQDMLSGAGFCEGRRRLLAAGAAQLLTATRATVARASTTPHLSGPRSRSSRTRLRWPRRSGRYEDL